MDRAYAELLIAEARRRARVSLFSRVIDDKFKEQKAFVQCSKKNVVAVCTRRAGKSYGVALRLFRAALKHPGSTPLYIALTRDSAKNIMWPALYEVNRKHGLQAEFHEQSLTIKLNNGSTIMLRGADTKNFIERLRGVKYPEVCIDEAQSFRSHLKGLIEDVLEPATLDYHGPIVLVGTPGPVPSGSFYEMAQKPESPDHGVFKWSLLDNPYLLKADAFLDKVKERHGWTDDNPTFRREYRGEWVIDLDALVYKFKHERNQYQSVPRGHVYSRILGIDYGWNDATALAIVSYSPTLRHVYVEHVEGHSEIIPSDIAERVKRLQEQYKPVKIVADTGGLGKSITEEFRRRYHLPIYPAEKKEKMTNISLMNGDFQSENLFVHSSCRDLIDQYQTLTWDETRTKENQDMPNDFCDAVLYAYREAKHYMGEVKEPEPEYGSKPWGEREEQRILDSEEEGLEKEEKEWWLQ